jgi:hypothetical protein
VIEHIDDFASADHHKEMLAAMRDRDLPALCAAIEPMCMTARSGRDGDAADAGPAGSLRPGQRQGGQWSG